MLQKGTLYLSANNENSVEIKEPITNVFIYFSQNGVKKLTAKTDSAGKFSFDLPLGSYQVTVSLGAGARIHPLANGAPFELTKDSTVDAFEQWVLAPVYLKPEENPLVILLNTIATEARESAQEAKKSAEDAERAVGDSVGSGKLMREGAYGFGFPEMPITREGDPINRNGFYRIFYNSGSFHYGSALNMQYNVSSSTLFGVKSVASKIPEFIADHYNEKGAEKVTVTFYTTGNTTIDSNGFLKAASPIIKLFDDRIETNGQFKEEPVFEKIGVGTYKISNTLGLAKEGWTYEKPRGKDGNPYFRIIVKKTDDGCIISVHDEFEALEEATITDIEGNERKINKVVKILGEARDIKPHERWIDLRFHEEPEEIGDLEEEQNDQDKFLEEHNAVLL